MFLRIEKIPPKKFTGLNMIMSLRADKTYDLWHSFMIRRGEIKNRKGSALYSIKVYQPSYFENFDPSKQFEKWAAAEVNSFDDLPAGMDKITIPEGLYAVFLHKGPANAAPVTFGYIFNSWIPNSEYIIDYRPHFEILGEKYKNDDPASEEEVFIPVKLKHDKKR